jgi:rod shape determining protein RodA
MINFRMLKLSDPLLWIALAGLVLFSFLAIFSSTYNLQMKLGQDPLFYVKKQFFSLLVALVGLIFFAYLDYKHLKKASPWLYLANLALLTLVLFSGKGAQGAQRWFNLGPLSFQPSEIAKIIIIISIAAFLNERKKITNLFEALGLISLVGVPFLLIFKQPDLGTALVFIAVLIGTLAVSEASPKLLFFLTTPFLSVLLRPWIVAWIIYLLVLALCLFLSRASFWEWSYLLGVNILVGIAVPFIWTMLKAYQRQRILTFFNPASDPYGAGYHSLQSKIAIGGGGLWGKGFLRGTQTQLQFIPEQHSDFIFSVVGEEFGFIGCMALMTLFALLVWRALVIGAQALDRFGFLLASGVAVMFLFHAFANIGMVLGLLPVVGIPLPLVSFGGSSLFMSFLAIGILQSVAMRRQKIIF